MAIYLGSSGKQKIRLGSGNSAVNIETCSLNIVATNISGTIFYTGNVNGATQTISSEFNNNNATINVIKNSMVAIYCNEYGACLNFDSAPSGTYESLTSIDYTSTNSASLYVVCIKNNCSFKLQNIEVESADIRQVEDTLIINSGVTVTQNSDVLTISSKR